MYNLFMGMIMIRYIALFLMLLGCSKAVVPIPAVSPYEDNSVLSEGISDRTVALVYKSAGEDGKEIYRPFCTGVWVSEREILTAGHCVESMAELQGAGKIGLELKFIIKNQVVDIGEDVRGVYVGRVLAVDLRHDLALIGVGGLAPRHGVSRLAERMPGVGTRMFSCGHVKGLYWTYVEGVVAAWRHEMAMSEFEGPFMQVSAPVYLGNSGGGIFNASGELVGIASFIASAPNAAFYIPLVHMKSFLKKNGVK